MPTFEVDSKSGTILLSSSKLYLTHAIFGAFRSLSVHRRYISSLAHSRNWEKKVADGPPCVVLASPGFLHTGPSRELLELWAPDSRNGLIITGYSVEGTMARVSFFVRVLSTRQSAA